MARITQTINGLLWTFYKLVDNSHYQIEALHESDTEFALDKDDDADPTAVGGRGLIVKAIRRDTQSIRGTDTRTGSASLDKYWNLQARIAKATPLGGWPGGTVAINQSTSGDRTIVAASGTAGEKTYGLCGFLENDGASNCTVTWKSGATAISGAIVLEPGDGYTLTGSILGPGLCGINAQEAMILNLSAAVQISGHLTYVYAP